MSSSAAFGAHGIPVTFAANNGEVGGGEVMLLAMAGAAAKAGYAVTVVAPAASHGVLSEASDLGVEAVALAPDRRSYLADLRRWDRQRHGLLWANGLVPALATAGRCGRVVHLHRAPQGRSQRSAAALARRGALATVVPSRSLQRRVGGAIVLPNWHGPVGRTRATQPSAAGVTFGFIGRLAPEKGIVVLLDAIEALVGQGSGVRLLVAGEARFVTPEQRRQLEAALDRLGSSVERLGWVSPEELFDLVDVLVVPSTVAESFGLVVTEAMSARVPVIVSDAGALPEVVGPSHPWVTRAGDASALASTLRGFLTTTSKEREAVASAAYDRWIAHFSPQVGEAAFLTLLDDLIARNHAVARP